MLPFIYRWFDGQLWIVRRCLECKHVGLRGDDVFIRWPERYTLCNLCDQPVFAEPRPTTGDVLGAA